MDLTSWIVWAILVVEVTALGFIGYWFSLRTLRLFTGVTAFILAIAVTRFGLTHPEYRPSQPCGLFPEWRRPGHHRAVASVLAG